MLEIKLANQNKKLLLCYNKYDFRDSIRARQIKQKDVVTHCAT